MNTFSFRPRAEALEDRLTPVSPADVFNAINTIRTDAQLLDYTRHNPGMFTVVTNAPSTKLTQELVIQQSKAAYAVLNEFGADLVAQMQKNPAAAGAIQGYIAQVEGLKIEALTVQGTAQQIVTFIDVTNRINSQAQTALKNAMLAGKTNTNPPSSSTGTTTGTTTTGTTGTTTTGTTGNTTSTIPSNVLNQLTGNTGTSGTTTTGTTGTTSTTNTGVTGNTTGTTGTTTGSGSSTTQ